MPRAANNGDCRAMVPAGYGEALERQVKRLAKAVKDMQENA